MKNLLLIFFFSLCSCVLYSQKKNKVKPLPIDSASITTLNELQDSMLLPMFLMREEINDFKRIDACYKFIPLLVQALKVPNSYVYKFDSLKNVSIVNSPDEKFRIFTWQVEFSNSEMRYFGVLQFRSKQSKNIAFYDYTSNIKNEDTITDNTRWWGAVYYSILKNTVGKQSYYTLLGWKGKNVFGVNKVAEVLKIDPDSTLTFGAAIFHKTDSVTKEVKVYNRFILSYKRSASVTLNYDNDQKMIVFDHVKDEASEVLNRPFACIPDGTYEGYKWKKDRWQHINKVFYTVMSEPFFGQPIFSVKDPKTMPKMK